MRTLLRTLQDYDLGFLRIIAELWGIDLPSLPPPEAAKALAAEMLQPETAREMLFSLPLPAQQALRAIVDRERRMPLSDVVRRFGPLREMGPGRRDRERPWREHASPAEVLWYRGWIARAFADSPSGPQEFAYIPSDLADCIPPMQPPRADPPGRPAGEPGRVRLATDTAIDDAATLLAALRRRGTRSLPLPARRLQPLLQHLQQPAAAEMLLALLRESGLLTGTAHQPSPDSSRTFLEATRAEALHSLQQTWREATLWNDLAHVPHLATPGGRWPNDPRLARRALLAHLQAIPDKTWWDLSSLIEAVFQTDPAFQRPGGDFDSWYVTDGRTGAYLQGFGAWQAVEGALLGYLVTGPLHWLGATDLGTDHSEGQPTSFRTTTAFEGLAGGGVPSFKEEPPVAASLHPDGRVVVPRGADRAHRYQIARWATWDTLTPGGYVYCITPQALETAAKQGLRAAQVLSILRAACASSVPDPLARAIERAASRGTEARLQSLLVLRVSSPRLLDELRRRRTTARYLGEALGRDAVMLRSEDWRGLCEAAARAGLLIEPPDHASHLLTP